MTKPTLRILKNVINDTVLKLLSFSIGIKVYINHISRKKSVAHEH